MIEKAKILIIEDDVDYRDYMLILLKEENFENVDVVDTFIEAKQLMSVKIYDVVLIDIFINGHESGLTLGKYINEVHKIPFIYVTSCLNNQMLFLIKDTYPVAVISKPVDTKTFVSNIKLAVYNKAKKCNPVKVLNDRIFLKRDGIFEKVYIDKIVYIESDQAYNYLYMSDGSKLLIRGRLSDFQEKFPLTFLQISKKYVININYIDHFDRMTITVNNMVLDVGRKFKDLVYGRLVTF
ncbi:MAG: response regulator transcription factor [Labilibaculum sp.]|nr:response regulator transcription factor [Labilibaculum sp.]